MAFTIRASPGAVWNASRHAGSCTKSFFRTPAARRPGRCLHFSIAGTPPRRASIRCWQRDGKRLRPAVILYFDMAARTCRRFPPCARHGKGTMTTSDAPNPGRKASVLSPGSAARWRPRIPWSKVLQAHSPAARRSSRLTPLRFALMERNKILTRPPANMRHLPIRLRSNTCWQTGNMCGALAIPQFCSGPRAGKARIRIFLRLFYLARRPAQKRLSIPPPIWKKRCRAFAAATPCFLTIHGSTRTVPSIF